MADKEDVKWLYGKLQSKGYDIGSEDEFAKSLSNTDDRKWYYDKASAMGLDIGSQADFDALFGPVQSSQTTTPAQDVSAESQQGQATAPAGAWKPTEQDKIRMQHEINQGMAAYRDNVSRGSERVARSAMPLTPEGRGQLRQAKDRARLVGADTSVGTQIVPLKGGHGQSPVPYDVHMRDGKPETEWLLNDGNTTDDELTAMSYDQSASDA